VPQSYLKRFGAKLTLTTQLLIARPDRFIEARGFFSSAETRQLFSARTLACARSLIIGFVFSDTKNSSSDSHNSGPMLSFLNIFAEKIGDFDSNYVQLFRQKKCS
jgi:hypothetical protein